MYEVPYKDTMKYEILPHLSVAKRGYVSEGGLAEVCSIRSPQVENGLPITDYFCFSMMSSWLVVSNIPHNRSRWLL